MSSNEPRGKPRGEFCGDVVGAGAGLGAGRPGPVIVGGSEGETGRKTLPAALATVHDPEPGVATPASVAGVSMASLL